MNRPRVKPIPVVVIDDDRETLRLTEHMLTNPPEGTSGPPFDVTTFTDPAEALANLPVEGPGAILCDYDMPGGTGLDWLPDLIRARIGPVLLLTGSTDASIAAQAFKAGATSFMIKEAALRDRALLHGEIHESLRRYRLARCNEELTTKLKRANLALAESNERLRTLNETAQSFVDNVAHEFRTPLTVIKEFASIIRDGIAGPVTDQQVEYLLFVDGATRDLAQMVEDFLDSGKLRSGTLRVDRRPRSVDELFASVRTMLNARAAACRIRIDESIEDGLPPVFIDVEKAGRVIINLVVNAVKFAPEASRVHLWAKRGQSGGVEIGVTDEGPGLSPEARDCIFERFHQTGIGLAASSKGFGLGLSIAKELVWLNLGRTEVDSEPGAGSTFSFTVPSHDTGEILERYLARISELRPSDDVEAIRFDTTNPDHDDPDRLRRFLASACYPHDLVLAMPAGTGAVAIGVTSDRAKWIARLRAIAGDTPAGEPIAFKSTHLASWECGTPTERLIHTIAALCEEQDVAHA